MNKKYRSPVRIIGIGLALSAMPLAWAAAPPTASACANVLSLISKPLTYQLCQDNGPTISQCIQNSLASQIPSSTESISAQLQDSNNASQSLAKLDFQCQYLIAYGSQPSPPGGSNPNGGFGSSLKNALGIKPTPSNTISTPTPNAAMNNQAKQLNNIQAAPPPSNKPAAESNSSNDKNNSINWF